MFDFVKKSVLKSTYEMHANSAGGDTLCFVKKLPYAEVDYNRFIAAEAVARVNLVGSVKVDLSKTCQPWNEATSPMVKRRRTT